MVVTVCVAVNDDVKDVLEADVPETAVPEAGVPEADVPEADVPEAVLPFIQMRSYLQNNLSSPYCSKHEFILRSVSPEFRMFGRP